MEGFSLDDAPPVPRRPSYAQPTVGMLCDLFEDYLPTLFTNIKSVRDFAKRHTGALPMACPEEEVEEYRRLMKDTKDALDENLNRVMGQKMALLRISVAQAKGEGSSEEQRQRAGLAAGGEAPKCESEGERERAEDVIKRWSIAATTLVAVREDMINRARRSGAACTFQLAIQLIRLVRFIRSRVYPTTRLVGDLMQLGDADPALVQVTYISLERLSAEVSIHTPKDGPFRGNDFRVIYSLTEGYPHTAPCVRLQPVLSHPNVDPFSGMLVYSGPRARKQAVANDGGDDSSDDEGSEDGEGSSTTAPPLGEVLQNVYELLLNPDLTHTHPNRKEEDLKLWRENPEAARKKMVDLLEHSNLTPSSPRFPIPACTALAKMVVGLADESRTLGTSTEELMQFHRVQSMRDSVAARKAKAQKSKKQRAKIVEPEKTERAREGGGRGVEVHVRDGPSSSRATRPAAVLTPGYVQGDSGSNPIASPEARYPRSHSLSVHPISDLDGFPTSQPSWPEPQEPEQDSTATTSPSRSQRGSDGQGRRFSGIPGLSVLIPAERQGGSRMREKRFSVPAALHPGLSGARTLDAISTLQWQLPSQETQSPGSPTSQEFPSAHSSSSATRPGSLTPPRSPQLDSASEGGELDEAIREQLMFLSGEVDEEDPRSPTIGVPRTPCEGDREGSDGSGDEGPSVTSPSCPLGADGSFDTMAIQSMDSTAPGALLQTESASPGSVAAPALFRTPTPTGASSASPLALAGAGYGQGRTSKRPGQPGAAQGAASPAGGDARKGPEGPVEAAGEGAVVAGGDGPRLSSIPPKVMGGILGWLEGDSAQLACSMYERVGGIRPISLNRTCCQPADATLAKTGAGGGQSTAWAHLRASAEETQAGPDPFPDPTAAQEGEGGGQSLSADLREAQIDVMRLVFLTQGLRRQVELLGGMV